jgi:hypothetical protein
MEAAEQKIWTNEGIPLLRQFAPISIIGQSSSSQADVAEQATVEATAANQPYVDANEEQIRETQAIRQTGDGITDAIPLDKEAPGLSPEATVEILKNQVAQLEAQIGDLQDLARRNGIVPAVVR